MTGEKKTGHVSEQTFQEDLSDGGTFEYTQKGIDDKAPPAAKREFYIAGQKEEAKKRRGYFERTKEHVARMTELKNEIRTDENAASIDAQIAEAEEAVAEAEEALQEIEAIYKETQEELAALTNEEITEGDEQPEVDNENNPVRLLMKRQYAKMDPINARMKAAEGRITAAFA